MTQLKAQLALLEESLKSIQQILTPLVDRATKQVTSIYAKYSFRSYVVEQAVPTFS